MNLAEFITKLTSFIKSNPNFKLEEIVYDTVSDFKLKVDLNNQGLSKHFKSKKCFFEAVHNSLHDYFDVKYFPQMTMGGNSMALDYSDLYDRLWDWTKYCKDLAKSIPELENLQHQNKTTIFNQQYSDSTIKTAFIDAINIDKFYCIQELTGKINNLSEHREIYFLGENGDGKTLLLQAITLAAKQLQLEEGTEKKYTGEALDLLTQFKANSTFKNTETNSILSNENPYCIENLFAYGVHRSRTSKDISQDSDEREKYGFMSLFNNECKLANPESWLLTLKLEQDEINYKGISTEKAIVLLEHLVDKNVKITIKGASVVFSERGAVIKFEQLSEGYKSVLTWVTDLISRLAENQPDFESKQLEDGGYEFDFQGIVLVDEINLHLHPKWEYTVVRKLRKWFPNIQFIFTTHSPITVLGASEDAIFYRLYKEQGITKISEPYHAKDMDTWLANVLITSPLFGLESARPAFFNEKEGADTANDSLTSRIRKVVKAEVEQLKKDGKVYFSPETIQNMIQTALKTAIKK